MVDRQTGHTQVDDRRPILITRSDESLTRQETGIDSFKFDAGEHNWLPSSLRLDPRYPESAWPGVFSTAYVSAVARFGGMVEVSWDHIDTVSPRLPLAAGADGAADPAPARVHADAGQVLHVGLRQRSQEHGHHAAAVRDHGWVHHVSLAIIYIYLLRQATPSCCRT